MSQPELPFFPGGQPSGGPLSRFLPPIPPGQAAAWLHHAQIPAGAWLLDPFGASPELVLELARAGYNLLVTCNNPILAFMIEVLASAPRAEEFRAALSELAAARKGDERLERHIQALYALDCPNCGSLIQARAFIWNKDESAPHACLIDCPNCGESGEKPVPASSQQRLSVVVRGAALHRARALERVSLPEDPLRPNVEQALNCYLTRPLYALFTLINKMEGLPDSADRDRLLTALLLAACDEGSTLWVHPTARSRPRLLSMPPLFRENNLWASLESAIDQWARPAPPVAFQRTDGAPGQSLKGGITLFAGRLKELGAALTGLNIQAVVTALPRPNQAFWTLSTLWAGWLWGRDAAAPLKNVLARQRFDWNWHAGALESAFSTLAGGLPAEIPVYALLAEHEPPFLAAALTAGASAGLRLDGLAQRVETGQAQIAWATAAPGADAAKKDLTAAARKAVQTHLERRGEPAPFAVLNAAIYQALAREDLLRAAAGDTVTGVMARVQGAEQMLFGGQDLLHYGSPHTALESGQWWLQTPVRQAVSLADQIEMESVRFLQRSPGAGWQQIDQALCLASPGLLTPPPDLILAMLESYGETPGGEPDNWRLRPDDSAPARRADIKEVLNLLSQLGEQMGYRISGERPLLWLDGGSLPDYAFYAMASTVVSQIIHDNPYPPARSVLVIPGSRANLLSFKLKRDPRLREAVNAGWRVVKFRHLRRMAGISGITRATFEAQLGADPLEYKAIQMEMF